VSQAASRTRLPPRHGQPGHALLKGGCGNIRGTTVVASSSWRRHNVLMFLLKRNN
jgi:hypothetical protein